MDKLRKIATKILLAFVLISIGFALGRNSTTRLSRDNTSASGAKKEISGKYLIVYYTHAMIRCDTCNNIEKSTHSILEKEFKNEMDSGVIKWKVVDFQEDPDFAEKFDVVASGVILAMMDDDKVVKIEKLEKVWTLIDKPDKFKSYIENAIKKCVLELKK